MSAHAGTCEVSISGARALLATHWLDDHVSRPEIVVAFRPASLPAFAGIVTLRGEHDVATSAELGRALASIDGDILVDLSSCPFIDGSVIGVLVAAARARMRTNHRLELVIPAANAAVIRVAEVVGLRTLVSVSERLPVDQVARSAQG